MKEPDFQEQDEMGLDLNRFIQTLRTRLGEAAEIQSEQVTPRILLTKIVPSSARACAVSIVEMGKVELIVNIAGGRWELNRSIDSLEFFKSVVESTIKGNVRETFGLERVDTRVGFPDGTFARTTTRNLGGLIRTPGWRHWGRKVSYEPYQSDDSDQEHHSG